MEKEERKGIAFTEKQKNVGRSKMCRDPQKFRCRLSAIGNRSLNRFRLWDPVPPLNVSKGSFFLMESEFYQTQQKKVKLLERINRDQPIS